MVCHRFDFFKEAKVEEFTSIESESQLPKCLDPAASSQFVNVVDDVVVDSFQVDVHKIDGLVPSQELV
jgi:hypothetical protein